MARPSWRQQAGAEAPDAARRRTPAPRSGSWSSSSGGRASGRPPTRDHPAGHAGQGVDGEGPGDGLLDGGADRRDPVAAQHAHRAVAHRRAHRRRQLVGVDEHRARERGDPVGGQAGGGDVVGAEHGHQRDAGEVGGDDGRRVGVDDGADRRVVAVARRGAAAAPSAATTSCSGIGRPVTIPTATTSSGTVNSTPASSGREPGSSDGVVVEPRTLTWPSTSSIRPAWARMRQATATRLALVVDRAGPVHCPGERRRPTRRSPRTASDQGAGSLAGRVRVPDQPRDA